jgi:hypothetical protein
VYVVHTDHKNVTLLIMTVQEGRSATLVLPSAHEAYAVDGSSSEESFTIICSPKEIEELTALSKGGMSHDRGVMIVSRLMERSKIKMPAQPERPFPIVGNVRVDSEHPFLGQIPI